MDLVAGFECYTKWVLWGSFCYHSLSGLLFSSYAPHVAFDCKQMGLKWGVFSLVPQEVIVCIERGITTEEEQISSRACFARLPVCTLACLPTGWLAGGLAGLLACLLVCWLDCCLSCVFTLLARLSANPHCLPCQHVLYVVGDLLHTYQVEPLFD